VPHLDCKVKLRTLVAGGSFSIHDLRVPVALWRFAAMKNSEGIGFIAALAPKNEPPPPPPGAKPKEGPGSFFEIASAELGDLNAILDFPGSWGLELRHAHARASLKQDGTDPAHPTFPPLAELGDIWHVARHFVTFGHYLVVRDDIDPLVANKNPDSKVMKLLKMYDLEDPVHPKAIDTRFDSSAAMAVDGRFFYLSEGSLRIHERVRKGD
jgi:hypothetical protein